MPSPYTLSDNDLLTLGQQAIDNSLGTPAVLDAVTPFGYDEAALQEGQALLDAFDAAVQTRRNEAGEQVRATDELNEAWDAFHEKTYMPNVLVAGILFDDGTQRRLGIDGQRPRAFSDYLQEARGFYGTVQGDADLQATLAGRGLTAERMTAAQEDVQALEDLNQAQEREKTEAQEATRQRDDERRAFADWLTQYQKFARVALRDQPDLAEQLGISAPSP